MVASTYPIVAIIVRMVERLLTLLPTVTGVNEHLRMRIDFTKYPSFTLPRTHEGTRMNSKKKIKRVFHMCFVAELKNVLLYQNILIYFTLGSFTKAILFKTVKCPRLKVTFCYFVT